MTMMICCGTEHTSNFCPNCGKKLEQNAIYDLLHHLERRFEIEKKHLQDCIEFCEDNNRIRPDLREKRIANKAAIVEKWRNWLEALAQLLQENQ